VGNHGDSARRDKALELAYQRACTNHEAISEFRVKLLGLLPLATGTVSLLLLRQQDSEHPEILQSLGPIGLLGLVVTVGLFAYELRGMQRCHRLEVQAGTLEEQLGLSTEEGPFLGQPPRSLEGMLGPPAAGLIIYVATAFIWLYIAGYGFSWWMNPFQAGWLVPAYGIVLAVAWMLLSRWLPSPERSDAMTPDRTEH
jgi:hypothetical protein